jgi:tetratricopeptide (TPR) repeat protein
MSGRAYPHPMPRLFLLLLGLFAGFLHGAAPDSALVREALDTEAQLDSARALELFLQADREQPNQPFILQKIARQYSDLVVDQTTPDAKKRFAQTALDYALRAVALEPENPVNVLSLAICHGKLAVYSDTRTKVKYSRLVHEEAERALALDPNYAWAHHVLGRWHHEVADLGSTARFFVRLFYGGLPSASVAKSIAHLQRAVELEPEELNHALELGFALAAAGRVAEARASWEQGLSMPSRAKHDDSSKQRARAALENLPSAHSR